MKYLKSFLRWLLGIFEWQRPLTQRINTAPKSKTQAKKNKITIKRYSPVYPDIRELETYAMNPPTRQTPLASRVNALNYACKKVDLMQKINRTFFGDKRRVENAIRNMSIKYPLSNELEILEKVDIQYRIRRG